MEHVLWNLLIFRPEVGTIIAVDVMRRVSLGRAIRVSFWKAYDHLGRLMVFNVLWILLGLPWVLVCGFALFLGRGFLQAGNLLVGLCVMLGGVQALFISPPTAGLFAVCRGDVGDRTEGVRAMLSMVRRYAARSQVLGLMMVGGTGILCANLLFYVRMGGVLGLALGGMMGWGVLFWALISLFAIPVLIAWEAGPVAVLKRSGLIVLGHPLFSLCLFAGTGMVLTVGLLTGVGLALLAMSFTAVLLNAALQELVCVYAPTEQDAEIEEDEKRRGWRDLLRPWEM